MESDRVLTLLKLGIEAQESQGLASFTIENLVKLARNAEHSTKQDYCIICSVSQVPQSGHALEEHHIAGKVLGEPNYLDTVTVCDRCHGYLSDHQRAWLLFCKEEAVRLSSYFFGWADVFDLLYNLSGTLDFERLAEKFRSQGYHIRNALGKRRHALPECRIMVRSGKRLKSR